MSYCVKCGQYGQADGGIGCVCHACPRCEAGEGELCFMCRGCRACGRAMMMHTSGQLQLCRAEKNKTNEKCAEDV